MHDRDNSSNSTTLPTQPTTLHTATEVTLTPTVTPISTVNPTSTVTPISTVTPTPPTVNTTSTVTQFPTLTLPSTTTPAHQTASSNNIEIHEVFYKNQFSNAYLTDERVLKSIVNNNVTIVNPDEKLKLTIYYKSFTTTNLVCKNNQRPNPPPLQQNNVIYEYNCSTGDCERLQCSYIGFTTTTLSRRLTMHLQHGAIKQHHAQKHSEPITRNIIVNNTKILRSESDCNRLQIFESLYIYAKKPIINNQCTGTERTVKLFNIQPTTGPSSAI